MLKEIFELMSSQKVMRILGREATRLIKKRTRLGYGVEKSGAAKKPLKALDVDGDPSYVEQRRRGLVPMNKKYTKHNKSNLTLTGDMLNSLREKVSKQKITITPRGKNNIDKTRWAEASGRKYLHLSKQEIRQLNQKLERMIDTLLKKL